jgi:hypothetical protein
MQRAHAVESRLTQAERSATLRPSLTPYISLPVSFQTCWSSPVTLRKWCTKNFWRKHRRPDAITSGRGLVSEHQQTRLQGAPLHLGITPFSNIHLIGQHANYPKLRTFAWIVITPHHSQRIGIIKTLAPSTYIPLIRIPLGPRPSITNILDLFIAAHVLSNPRRVLPSFPFHR